MMLKQPQQVFVDNVDVVVAVITAEVDGFINLLLLLLLSNELVWSFIVV
jgi:hypothetical protein